MPAKNTLYDNFVLESMIGELVASQLDLQQFATPDASLEGQPGMIKKINRYTASDGTQKLDIGEGNTVSIAATYAPEEYRIQLAQNRFEYHDEEDMTDPIAIETGIRKQAAGLFDQMNADVYAEWEKAYLTTTAADAAGIFGAFVDAQSYINQETLDQPEATFAVLNNRDLATVRKALGSNLQYVEAYARQGYVGTVAGTPLYVKKNATPGKIYMATRSAVTIFYKSGVEVENLVKGNRSADDANVRLNSRFARQYYVAALTDATKVVEISIPTTPEVIITSRGETVGVGDTVTLGAVAYPAGSTVAWSSGTTTKATIGATTGVVTGVSAGTSLVTATMTVGASTYTDTVLITVEA